MSRALAWGLVLAGALTLAGLTALQLDRMTATSVGEDASVHAVFVNRSGFVFFNQTLHVPNATALGALDTAAHEGNFTYHVTHYPGFGSREAGAFVDMVADEWAERGSPDGWIYRLHRDGRWIVPDRSAALYPLEEGDVVVWAWSAAWEGP